jgi:hypothetical protein
MPYRISSRPASTRRILVSSFLADVASIGGPHGNPVERYCKTLRNGIVGTGWMVASRRSAAWGILLGKPIRRIVTASNQVIGGSNPSGRAHSEKGNALAKPQIEPLFAIPSSMIVLGPFRYVWNNLPRSAGGHVTLVVFALIAGFVVIAVGLSWLMTACWRLWR